MDHMHLHRHPQLTAPQAGLKNHSGATDYFSSRVLVLDDVALSCD